MSRSDDETKQVRLFGVADSAVRRVAEAASTSDSYDAAAEVAGEASSMLLEARLAASVYGVWSDITDLFDYAPLGVPEEGASALAKQVACEWLARRFDEREVWLDRWRDRDLIAMVEDAGYVVLPPSDPRLTEPWRGQWEEISWSVENIGVRHSPYVAAQRVIRALETDPALWEPG